MGNYSNPQHYLTFYYRGLLLKILIWQKTSAERPLPSHSEILLCCTVLIRDQNINTVVPHFTWTWCTSDTEHGFLLFMFLKLQAITHTSPFSFNSRHVEQRGREPYDGLLSKSTLVVSFLRLWSFFFLCIITIIETT